MNKDPLDTAIELVKLDKQAEALPILTMLIRNDPHDEKAWMWLIQAVPQNQRRVAAEMFYKDNPDSELAKKALRVVGRQISQESSSVPVILPVSSGEKKELLDPSFLLVEASEEKVNPFASTLQKVEIITPELPPERNVNNGAITSMQIKRSRQALIIITGIAIVFVFVLGIVLIQKGLFPNLSLLGSAPTKIPNLETQFAAVQNRTPLVTFTPIPIMSATPDSKSTPTAGISVPITPLTTPFEPPIINLNNVIKLLLVSKAPMPQQSVIVSPKLSFILPLNGSSEIRLLDFNSHEILFRAYLPSDSLALAAFTQDETYLATAVTHGDIIIYDIHTGKSIRIIQTGSLILDKSGSMIVSADGRTLAVISSGQYGVWNLDSGELLGKGNSLNVPMAVSDKMLFLSCASFVCAEDITTGKQINRFGVNGASPLFALSTEGEQIAIKIDNSDNLQSVAIYDTATGTQRAGLKTPLSDIWGLAYSPDASIIAVWGVNSANDQYALVLLDVINGANLKTIDIGLYQDKVGMKPLKLTFTADGTSIVAITSVEVMIFAVQ